MYIFMYVFTYVCKSACMYVVRMCVCMHICTYIRMYVCMYVCITLEASRYGRGNLVLIGGNTITALGILNNIENIHNIKEDSYEHKF